MIAAFFGLAQKVQQAIIIALLVALGLACLAVVALVVAALYYRGEAANAKLELSRCAGDLAVSQANVDTLKGSIANQNRAVDALKEEADKRVKAAEEARKRADSQAKANERLAGEILSSRPANPDDLCGSALTLYREKGRK